MRKLKGLVVDDDLGILETIGDMLAVLDHEYECATSALEARQMLAESRYDYVVLDMEIPAKYGGTPLVRNGQSLLTEIRKMHAKETLPVIVITGRMLDKAEYASELLWNGANDFIAKPFPLTGHTLEASIAKFVAESKSAASSKRPEPVSEWLSRSCKHTTTVWKSTAKDGLTREIVLRSTSKLNRVIDCVYEHYRNKECIHHGDFIDRCGWTDKEYFKRENGKGNPRRGPIKNHLSELRQRLGIRSEFAELGIVFYQPEA